MIELTPHIIALVLLSGAIVGLFLGTFGGGGSVWSPELQRACREALPHATQAVGVGYGSTECAGLATHASNDVLAAHPEIATFVQTVQTRLAQIASGGRELVLHGDGFIEEELAGLEFRDQLSSAGHAAEVTRTDRNLGAPEFVRRDGPAQIWQYRAENCVLDLFLYGNFRSGR